MTKYTDEQRVDITKKEYDSYKASEPVLIDEDTTTIGFVAPDGVVDKSNGYQAYVITDNQMPQEATTADYQKVDHVTFLCRGSSSFSLHGDGYEDWANNDVPQAARIAGLPSGPPPQLQEAAAHLKQTIAQYPNAEISLYGHSLGSMEVQYALSCLTPEEASHVKEAHMYQGPNIYGTLNDTQRQTVDAMKDRVFNYVDPKDLVGAYGNDFLMPNMDSVGQRIWVDSAKTGAGSQHMFGGYRYDAKGNLKTHQNLSAAMMFIATLADNRKNYRHYQRAKDYFKKRHGDDLSDSEMIYLDNLHAAAAMDSLVSITLAARNDLQRLYDTMQETLDSYWRNLQDNCTALAPNLSFLEMTAAMTGINVTFTTIIQRRKDACEQLKTLANQRCNKYQKLAQKIKQAIAKQVATDTELAAEIKEMR